MPGSSIQAAVDQAGPNAAFCLKNGVHRMQVVRPLDGQSFYGEGGTILNGSRLLTEFTREGSYWVANGQTQHGQKHGECLKTAPACDLPEAVFIDDKPLAQVLSKDGVKPGSFYFDYAGDRIYLGDDPTGHKVEATVGAFAFESLASNVLIKNLIIEKYANPAQKGAIYSLGTTGWSVENSELRLNSGAGIVIGNGAKVLSSNLHHNGQTGIAGEGNDVLIENNLISANNIYGFDYKWEAGGVKLATSDGVVMRGNQVYRQCRSWTVVRHRLPQRPLREQHRRAEPRRRDLSRDFVQRRHSQQYRWQQRPRRRPRLVLGRRHSPLGLARRGGHGQQGDRTARRLRDHADRPGAHDR